MKQKLLSLFFVLTCFIGASYAQNRQVSGRVTSATDGSPVTGVSVSVVGSTTATQTDGSGNYSISVSNNSVLNFSYIGYVSQRVTVGNQVVINVQLVDESEVLDEVIVTAYGTQTRESVTGSIATFKAQDLAQVQTGNAIQSLAGKVSGAQIRSTTGQPGEAPTVRFRGLGSISSSNDPLYVVDGVPFNGDIASISSQDIEEISFLKDAAANALYGSRGANGVIIITTKKGRGAVEINFETRGGYNSRAVKDYDIIKDPAEYMELRWQRLRIGYMAYGDSDADARQYATEDLFDDLGINPFNVANDAIVDPLTGKINPAARLLYHDDWSKYLFENSFRQEHSLNVRYGNEKINTYLSGGYLKDNGYVVNSGFDRASARANVEFKPYDFLKLGTNVNFAATKMKNPQAGKETNTFSNLFSWSRNIAPIYPIFARDASGSILRNGEGRELYDWGRGETVGSTSRPYIPNMNPYATTLLNTQSNDNTNLGLRAFASIDFLENFNFTYNLSYDYLSGNRFRYATEEGGDAAPYGGQITNAVNNENTFTNQQFLSYKKTFGAHDLDVMVGHEVSSYTNKMLAGGKTNIVIPNNLIISNASKYSFLNGYNDQYKVEGYLSRVNYSYDHKYYASASFRRDGSSVFHPDHRWGSFYGLGGAWIVSKEDFFQNQNAISNLKLKISYGEQGNDNLYYPSYVNMEHRSHFGFSRNYLPYMDQYEIVSDAEGNPSISQAYTGTEDLKWEVSRNFNTGFELGLFDDRLNFDVEYFTRKVSDMLYNFPQPASSGIPAIAQNIGDMKNTGVEVTVNGDAIRSTDLNLNVWVNATHYKNKVTRLPDPFVSGLFRFVEGQSAYTYYLREFVGVNPETGNALWNQGSKDDKSAIANGDKTTTEIYTAATQYLLTNKTANPDLYGGFGFDISYKKLSLNVGFAYQIGGYVFDEVYQGLFNEDIGMGASGANFHKDVYQSWTPENTSATLPILSVVYQQQYDASDFFLTSASYLSLENVGISYDISNRVFDNVGIKNSRLSLMGNNLYIWSKRQGLDPRMMQLGGELNNGRSLNNYSLLRTISLGLTVNF